MAIYLISLNEASPEVWDKVRDHWPQGRHLILTDRMAFVAPQGVALTGEIAKVVGLDEVGRVSGLVVELQHYGGFNSNALVEWMGKVSDD